MTIKPEQLVKDELPLHEDLPEGTISFADDVRQVGPLQVRGRAELLIEDRGRGDEVHDIRLRGSYSGHFEQLCGRCLDPVAQALESSFDLIFRPEAADAEAGERAITEEETEIGYYEKSGLVLEDVLREQVLLALPGRALCQEDCRGLCPRCGKNRNVTACDCEPVQEDVRWSALAGLKVPVADAKG
jgi:uncharacterized protein